MYQPIALTIMHALRPAALRSSGLRPPGLRPSALRPAGLLGLLLIAALALAACTGPGSYRTVRGGAADPGQFARNYLQYAGRDAPVLVEARGDALGLSAEALAPVLASHGTGAVFGLPTRFTADATQVTEPNWRLVFLFDPAPRMREDDLCDGTARQSGSGSLDVVAAFCHRDRPYASVSGYAQTFGGVDDPAFRAYVRQIVGDMFPITSDGMRGADDWDG